MRTVLARWWYAALLAGCLLTSPNVVTAGDRLPAWRYTVRPGDTLIGIAERYLVASDRWTELQQTNQIEDPDRLLPGTVLRIPVSLLRSAPAAVTLETSSGSVRWRQAGDWRAASQGQQLFAGATLETLADASALLRLADGSKLLLGANSLVVFDALGVYAGGLMVDTRLRLQRGESEVVAAPYRRGSRTLRIQTPSAQAVVRGTHFRLGFDGDVTREETLTGQVGVSASARSVKVPAGKGTLVRKGQPPEKAVDLLPAPDIAALPPRLERLPLRFPLPPLAGARAWHGEIAPDRKFERILLSKTASGAALTFADLPNGEYVLRVRATDGRGLQGRDAVHAFTVFARPFAPGLNYPGDGAKIRTARPNFAWSEAQEAAGYRVQVAGDGDFAQPLHEGVSEGNKWFAPEDLPVGGLSWRVASVDVRGQPGPWSAPAWFTYQPGPGAPDLGRSSIEYQPAVMVLNLGAPPEGLLYEAVLSSTTSLEPELARAQSGEEKLTLPRPDGGSYFLGVRQVDRSDNTAGPYAVQKIDVPYSRWWWLLLLVVPLAL